MYALLAVCTGCALLFEIFVFGLLLAFFLSKTQTLLSLCDIINLHRPAKCNVEKKTTDDENEYKQTKRAKKKINLIFSSQSLRVNKAVVCVCDNRNVCRCN